MQVKTATPVSFYVTDLELLLVQSACKNNSTERRMKSEYLLFQHQASKQASATSIHLLT